MLILWPLNTQIVQENACHEGDLLLDKKSRLTTSSLNCSSVESLLMENSTIKEINTILLKLKLEC